MSNNRSCNKYDRMIDDYIDGLLSDKDASKLEAHLAECEDCRASLRFSLALREMTRASAEKLPQEVHDKILAETGARGRRRQLVRRGALSAACALIFIVSAVAWAILPGKQNAEDVPPENLPSQQITVEETNMSINQELPDKLETDAESPIPEIMRPSDNNTAAEEQAPGEPGAAPAPEGTEKDEMIPDFEAEEITQKPENNAAAEITAPLAETDSRPDTEQPVAESLGAERPGGEDITLALLIVSGLLAIASFVAFLISLSSVRKLPAKKDKE